MKPYSNLKNPEYLWLLLILIVSAVLRFWDYGSFSYSNDELSALNRLHYSTFSELVQKGFYVDGHPGGIQVFLWQWVKYFGDSEWAVRFPFVLMGILSVWMSYKVAKFMFGVSAGLFTAAAISFLQFPLLYSQIARPYGSGMLFCLMLVYFWLNIFFGNYGNLNRLKPKITHLAGFIISAALCMYNHYFSFLFALLVGLSGFVAARKNNVFYYVAAASVAALLFIPHIPITLNHLMYKGVGLWLGVPDKTWIIGHLYYIFDESRYILVVFLLTLLTLIYLNRKSNVNLHFRLYLGLWFLLPMLIGYIYSLKVSPVLQHPVLIFSFPYFLMLLFSNAGDTITKNKSILLTIFLLCGISGTALINGYYSKQHFGEFRDIARQSTQFQKEYGDDSLTKAISVNSPYYIDFYLQRYNSEMKFDIYDIRGTEGLQLLSELVKNSRKPYFLYALTKPAPDEGEDIIRSVFPNIVAMKEYGGLSSLTLFARDKGYPWQLAHRLTEIKMFVTSLNEDSLVPEAPTEAQKAFKMDSTAEYSPGIEIGMDDYVGMKNLVIAAETALFSQQGSGGDLLVISVENAEGKSIFWKGSAANYIETPGKWCKLINTMKIDQEISKGSKMKVYFWNKDKKVLYLKNLKCRIYSQ